MNLIEKLETVKSKLKSSPQNEIQLPRKISFHGGTQKEKVVLCYRCKTLYMLGENCPEATPTPEDSGMSFIEQSGTPQENLAPVEPESSVEICSSLKFQLKTSPLVEEAFSRENFSMGGTSLESDLGSGSESSINTDSQLESLTGPELLRRNRQACHLRKLICDGSG